MILGEWHHRPGGKWRVDEVVKTGDWYYEWRAEAPNGTDVGYAPFAFLARHRAIAALRRMAATGGA